MRLLVQAKERTQANTTDQPLNGKCSTIDCKDTAREHSSRRPGVLYPIYSPNATEFRLFSVLSEILDTSTTANPPASLNNPHQFPCRLNNPRPWAFPALEGRNTPILDSSYHLPSWPRTASTTGGDATAAAFLALDANFFLARGCLGEEAPEQAREDARLYLATPRQGPLRHLLLALHHHRCLLRKALKCC
jgi:hypothetical protein